jgi:hypothetical protein
MWLGIADGRSSGTVDSWTLRSKMRDEAGLRRRGERVCMGNMLGDVDAESGLRGDVDAESGLRGDVAPSIGLDMGGVIGRRGDVDEVEVDVDGADVLASCCFGLAAPFCESESFLLTIPRNLLLFPPLLSA